MVANEEAGCRHCDAIALSESEKIAERVIHCRRQVEFTLNPKEIQLGKEEVETYLNWCESCISEGEVQPFPKFGNVPASITKLGKLHMKNLAALAAKEAWERANLKELEVEDNDNHHFE